MEEEKIMSEAKPTGLQKRFESAVAAYVKSPTLKNRVRIEQAEARMYGVAQRQVAKLARKRRT